MADARTIARLEARILERAAHCLEFEIKDPRATFVTITRVELSRDVTSGKISYSVLGDAGARSKAAHMLESAAGFVQRQVASVLKLRHMPHLRWVYDESVAHSAHMDELIQGALNRDREIRSVGTSDLEPEGEAETEAKEE